MNRTKFNRAFAIQTEENTQFLMHELNGHSRTVKIEDLGTKGTVHVIDKEGKRFRAIEKLLTFYEVPQPDMQIATGATILVNGEEQAYDPEIHFWIERKAMWINLDAASAGNSKEVKQPFAAGISIQISPHLVKFFTTDVKSSMLTIAGKMGKPTEKLFVKAKAQTEVKGIIEMKRPEDGGVEISIDGLTIKKVTTYLLNRISDVASIVGFFIASGFEEKIEKETKELKKFMDDRDEHLGK